jgi:tripartite-type tricarboxylate transporter receptor subunit TctC
VKSLLPGRLLGATKVPYHPRPVVSIALVLLTMVLTGGGCAPSPAPNAAEYFRAKTVRIVVNYAAGGGYDLNARVVAEFLGRHLPGIPNTVVENMPGAGGLIAASYFAHQAPADGLVVGLLGPSVVIPQVLEQEGVQYDVRDFPVVGALTSGRDYVCISGRDGGIDLAGWRDRGVRLGTPGRGASGHVQAAFIAAALHLPVRFVTGYNGTADVRQALDAGEVDVMCMQLASYYYTVAPTGRYVPILQSDEDSELLALGVPSASRLVSDDAGRALLGLRAAFLATDRFFVVPKETPAPIVQALRDGFAATLADAEFRAAAKNARMDTGAIAPDAVASNIATLFALPADQRQALKTLIAAESLR